MAAYEWFARWLKGEEDKRPEPEIQLATLEDLQCTPSGQVVDLPDAETVFSLNRKRAQQIRRPQLSPDEMRNRVRELTGFTGVSGPVPLHPYGPLARDGYHIEKLVYESEPGIQVPALLFVPAMKKQQRFFLCRCRDPGAVEELRAIPADQCLFSRLHVVTPAPSPHRAAPRR